MRIAIAGIPKSGKTALSEKLGGGLHTDDLARHFHWGDHRLSTTVAEWLDWPGENLIIEGVAVVRGLREWLNSNPAGKPIDRIIWLDEALQEYTLPGQTRMAKGCRTVFEEIRWELVDRGVDVMADYTFDELVDIIDEEKGGNT